VIREDQGHPDRSYGDGGEHRVSGLIADPKENGGAFADSAIPALAPPRTDQGYPPEVIRTATASERPSVGPGRARDNEPARIPLMASWPARGPTNDEPRHPPARPETRPNQRLYVPLGSPPSVAVGYFSARAAHRSRAPQTDTARMTQIAAGVKISRRDAGKKATEGLCAVI